MVFYQPKSSERYWAMQQNWLPGWVSVVLGGISSSIGARSNEESWHRVSGSLHTTTGFVGNSQGWYVLFLHAFGKRVKWQSLRPRKHWFIDLWCLHKRRLISSDLLDLIYSSPATWHDDTFAQMHHQIMLSQLLFVRFWKASFSFFLLAFNVCLQQLGSFGNWVLNAKDVKTYT